MKTNWLILIPLILGSTAVLQAAINRRVFDFYGFHYGVLLSGLIMVLVALIVMIFWGAGPTPLIPWNLPGFKIWYLLPGVLGYLLVSGLPYSFKHLGASTTFLLLICSQIVFSALWDHFIEGREFSIEKLSGAGLVILGAWLVGKK